MRIREHLYFAPGIKFSNIDTTGTTIAEQVCSRIQGFYLQPVHLLIEGGHAFAAGVMLVVAIDALARLETGNARVGDRFRYWCTAHLPSCTDTTISKRFYEAFRNGLVHEARIKDGGEFSLEIERTFKEIGKILSCNPKYLLGEVETALSAYRIALEEDVAQLEAVRGRILNDFAYELNN